MTSHKNIVPTVSSELLVLTHELFVERATTHSKTVGNHRIKYIIFKSSSSKYNEVFYYYLYFIKELPVHRNPFSQPSKEAMATSI